MKRCAWITLVVAITLFSLESYAANTKVKFRRVKEPALGRYIVVLNESVDVPAAARELTQAFGGRTDKTMDFGIKAFGLLATDETARQISQHPQVDYVEESAILHYSAVQYLPTSSQHPDYATFWGLDRIDDFVTPPTPWVRDYTYEYTSSGDGVQVYVIDTGIQRSHTEFVNVTVEDGANYSGDAYPATAPCGTYQNYYNAGHGTSVASVIGGAQTGVAKDVTLIPVKITPCVSHEPLPPPDAGDTLAACYALNWVMQDLAGKRVQAGKENPPRYVPAVVNMSFWFDPNLDNISAFESNINTLIEMNVTVVVSANNQNSGACQQSPARLGYGNEPRLPSDPWYSVYRGWGAANLRTITVGGTNPIDGRWLCSGFGCPSEPGSNYGPCVSIWAPAEQIRSAHMASATSYRGDSNTTHPNAPYSEEKWHLAVTSYNLRSGTSFAAPFVTGIVARMLQRNSTLTPQQVWSRLYGFGLPTELDLDGSDAAAADTVPDRIANVPPTE